MLLYSEGLSYIFVHFGLFPFTVFSNYNHLVLSFSIYSGTIRSNLDPAGDIAADGVYYFFCHRGLFLY